MRCNLVDPRILTDQHLMAERRELRMIPPLLKKQYHLFKTRELLLENLPSKIPTNFTLGPGHMLFWLNKFKFLETRFNSLTTEMKVRGFNPDETLRLEVELAKETGLYETWRPSLKDIEKSKNRLIERILKKPTWYRYHRLPISAGWIELHYLVGTVNVGTWFQQ